MKTRSRDAIVRGSIYGLLARGFGYPSDELFHEVIAGEFAEDLIQLIGKVHPACAAKAEELAPDLRGTFGTLQEFEAQYLKSFETELPAPPMSLYATTYARERPRAELLLEISAFHEAFGLRMDDRRPDFQDGLVAELEFMQFLAAKQAQALDADLDVGPYLRAQRDFLTRHLVPFLAGMDEAADKASSVFYRALVRVARQFVTADRTALIERTVIPQTSS